MIIYSGKAKDYNLKVLLYLAFWKLAKPVEKLEPEDFGKN